MTIERKGIATYLVLTFVVTYAIDLALIATGFRVTEVPALAGQLVVAATMWVPAVAALLTLRFVTHEGLDTALVRVGPLRPYLAVAIIVPLVFVLIFLLTWALGLGEPDWALTEFLSSMESLGADAPAVEVPVVLLGLLAGTLIFTPFVNSVFGFGEELGWRGFLLPRLMPLGKARAYLILGVIWGLWHAPLIAVGFNYPGRPVAGIFAMIALTTGLGVFINELTLHYRSSILAGWIHGVFNAQAYGIWRLLLPTVNPLVGGITGVLAAAVWLAVGVLTAWWFRRRTGAGVSNAAPVA